MCEAMRDDARREMRREMRRELARAALACQGNIFYVRSRRLRSE
jgi:predicted nucleic acid-binding Zn ribbon protein